MKSFKILFLLLFVSVLTACAQQKKYVSYTVKTGETIKSIAKDNGLKTRELLRLNPDVSKRPSPNTVIIIPNKSYNPNAEDSVKKGFHKVAKKETLFSISQKYGVTVEAIKQINNLQGDILSEGRIIRIPEKQEIVIVEEVKKDSIQNTHLVVKDDTLYNLSKRYNLSSEELLQMNPSLKDGLKLGMTIFVGDKEFVAEESKQQLVFKDTITNKHVKVVILLPYKLNKPYDYESEFASRNSLLNVVTDFHSGAMIAIDSLRKQGMHISYDIFDTENSFSKIESIARGYDFDNVDFILGPLFLKNAKQISKVVGKTPVIAPIYSKKQTGISGSNLVKVAPNKSLISEKLTSHLIEIYDSEKIILIGDTSIESTKKVASLKSKLIENNITDITIVKPEHGYISKEKFVKVIDTVQKKNWVVLVSDNRIVTTDVVNNLGVMPYEKRAIIMFGFNKGSNFKNVSNDRLARLQYTFPEAEFKDVATAGALNFNRMYKEHYYVRPSDFAIRGFDTMYDTLIRLSNAATFDEGATQGVSERIYTKFNYEKHLLGSTENVGVFLLQYQKNLELISIK